MAWFRADDGLPFHRKVLRAGNEAVGAWVRAGAWSSSPANLTDGWIPAEVCAQIAPPRVWAKLREVGLTEAPADGLDGEQIHDFLDYNPSAESVRGKRSEWAQKKANWREKRRVSTEDKRVDTPKDKLGSPPLCPDAVPPAPFPLPVPDPPLPPTGGDGTPTAPGGAAQRFALASPEPPQRRTVAKPKRSIGAEPAHTRYAKAYAAGMTDVTLEPFTPPTDSHAQLVFRHVLPTHARAPSGEPLAGDALLAWIRASVAEWRRCAKPDAARYTPGFRPSHWQAWLDAGRPGAASVRQPIEAEPIDIEAKIAQLRAMPVEDA